MNSLLFNVFIFFSFVICSSCQHGEEDHHIASLLAAEKTDSAKCGYDYRELWSHEVGHSPFVSQPLVSDVNADGRLDIVAALFTGSVTLLGAESGAEVLTSDWPIHYTDRSFHTSPLQFDVDGDGRLDVVLTSSDGELFFLTATGRPLDNLTVTIPPVYVRRDWFTQVVTISHVSVHDFILDDPPSPENTEYVPVEPHVLSTPVLADLNADDRTEELILPVSYYYNTEDFRLVHKLSSTYNVSAEILDKFLVSAVVTVNLTSRLILSTVHLDLTQVSSVFPGYLLATPTVLDLDREGGACEIVVATGAGNLHVIESTGAHRTGFPVVTNSLTTQVIVAEVLGDGFLQLVTVDTSGNVACYDRGGDLVWESEVSGSVTSDPQLTDIDKDGRVELLISTEDGAVHVLRGETGQEVNGWPVELGVKLSAVPLVALLSNRDTVDIVTLAEDGNLYLLSGDQRCRAHISIGETSLVQVMAHDLVSQSEGLELLVLTNDGTVLCFGRNSRPGSSSPTWSQTERLSSPFSQDDSSSFYRGPNKTGVVIVQPSQGIMDVSSSSFWLQYHIVGPPLGTGEFRVKVYFGRYMLAKTSHPEPGEYFLSVPSWLVPCHGHVTVVLTNHHGQRFHDSLPVRFYEVSHRDLRWLLCGPFLAMSALLLILHGFPAKDLLPVTVPSKTR